MSLLSYVIGNENKKRENQTSLKICQDGCHPNYVPSMNVESDVENIGVTPTHMCVTQTLVNPLSLQSLYL